MTEVSMILSATNEGIISYASGGIPWQVPEITQYLKDRTKNCAVIMGRKAWQSFPASTFADNINVVITNSEHKYSHHIQDTPNVLFINPSNVDRVIASLKTKGTDIFFVGGGLVFSNYIDYVDTLYYTEVRNAPLERGDYSSVWLSTTLIEDGEHWRLNLTRSSKTFQTSSALTYRHLVLERVPPS